MEKFVKKVLLFAVCIASLTIALMVIQDVEFIVGRKKTYLEKSRDKHYDLLVIGSSRAFHTFNPNLYQGSLKIFNAGEEGHGLPSNYLMLKVLVEKYQITTDKILLQIDELSFNGSKGFSREFRDDFFVEDLDDPEVFEAFKKYRGPALAYSIKFFPPVANLIYCDFYHFLKYMALSFRKFVPGLNKVYQQNLEQYGKIKGYKPLYPAKNDVELLSKVFKIEKHDMEYFLKLMDFCKSRNIKVYMYRAPVLQCQYYQSGAFDEFIRLYGSAHNIPFYDYKCKYQWADQYMDQEHSADSITSALTKHILFRLGMAGN